MVGIYKIENIVNHKVYIGQSIDIKHRFNQHKNYLVNNKHSNSYLQRAWNKYGLKAFKFEIIEECKSRNELNSKETYWFNYYVNLLGKNNVYNLGSTGDAHNTSDITRKRMKKRAKLTWDNFSKETKERIMNNLSRGYWKGKKFSEEQKKKMSESLKGHPSWAKKHHSKKTIEKMKANAYLYRTKEYRENMSKIIKQKYKDNPEMSLKISKALKGKHTSPKTEFKKGHKYYK